MKTKEEKFSGVKLPGIPAFVFNIILLFASIILLIKLAADMSGLQSGIFIVADSLLFVFSIISFGGFMQIEPNEARVMIFFGKYEGTVKENGFFWVNPFYAKKKLTLRARNLDAEPIKVNDKNGNPIMIGQVIVWKVVDTYKASFDIDSAPRATGTVTTAGVDKVNEKMKSYEYFVKVQSDAALRMVAGMYAYDNSGDDRERLTLRSGGEEMNEILENQLNERLALAGIVVVEARINYLAYAPEIAAVMLRRQQADAIIAARERIVDGAVGMVKHALDKLSEDGIIELDDEKKAAMVSNLLVVLCGEEHAQPIINTGTLYN
ncbi:MAG: SPFH domain-containing protein [Tannerella sp.]|jgi:regulator of protease activity HflC (stomatin/prohibitin superfamily)|nr:SPFH domain-containing protein [Tannerella sp.]